MRLESTYLNQRVEVFDAIFDEEQAEELRAVSRLYNRQLGPVEALKLHRPEIVDLPLYSSSCRHSPVASLMKDIEARPASGQSPLVPAGGKGATSGQAIAGALGEAAERLLSMLHYQHAQPELVLATFDELQQQGVAAIDPSALSPFAPQQYEQPRFRWRPFTRQTPVRWIAGQRLLTGERVMTPAQFVFLWYEHARGETPIGYPTTGGLAFHTDRRRAILHGLYEVVERDAINVSWMCRIPPSRVEIDTSTFLRDHCGLERRMSSAFVSNVSVFLNSLDVPIPVFTVIAFDDARDALTMLAGGGAWSTKERALTQALFEAGQCRSVLKTLEHEADRKIQPGSASDAMSDFLDGTVFYGYRDNRPLLEWYMSGPLVSWTDVPSFHFEGLDEEWDAVRQWLSRDRLDPIVVDLGSACSPGSYVVKVIVPELTAAWVPAEPMLGHPRYYEMARKLGLADTGLRFEQLNDRPLPFP
jgi:ribosomal protein S12 methylthiotransferase accessory factor